MLDKQKALFCQGGQAQDLLLPLEDPPGLERECLLFPLPFQQELQTRGFLCAEMWGPR